DVELLLERHHQLDEVEAVRVEVLLEPRLLVDRLGLDAEDVDGEPGHGCEDLCSLHLSRSSFRTNDSGPSPSAHDAGPRQPGSGPPVRTPWPPPPPSPAPAGPGLPPAGTSRSGWPVPSEPRSHARSPGASPHRAASSAATSVVAPAPSPRARRCCGQRGRRC